MARSDARMKLLDAALRVAIVEKVQDPFGGDVTAWCKANHIKVRTFYRHKKRIEAEGAWTERSRRPRTSPRRTPPEVEAAVLELRDSLGRDNGADNIRFGLETVAQEQGWAGKGWSIPSRAAINKILKRNGKVTPQPKKRPKSSYRRFAYAKPRDCYQIDATQLSLATETTAVVFEVLDDNTRLLAASHAADAETSVDAITAITKAFTEHGVPAIVLSDNGVAFTHRLTNPGAVSKFTKTVQAAGARLIHSSPYHPQTCGKVERHHRTFKEWLADQPVQPATVAELQALCDTYRHWYNHQRRHSAWNKPPARAWADAPALGGPDHLPIQTDAAVHHRTVSTRGTICIGRTQITLGTARKGQAITVLRDGDHVIAYNANGTVLGHLTLDHTKRHQGQLRPAA